MLGKNVAYLRKKKGLNNYRFSLLTGVDNAGIIRIENGQSKDPALSTVIKLAKVFNISLDKLVFEDLEAKEKGGSTATLGDKTSEKNRNLNAILQIIENAPNGLWLEAYGTGSAYGHHEWKGDGDILELFFEEPELDWNGNRKAAATLNESMFRQPTKKQLNKYMESRMSRMLWRFYKYDEQLNLLMIGSVSNIALESVLQFLQK